MNLTEELEWINFKEAKRAGDTRNELIAFFGSRTYEKLETRYRLAFPTPMEQAIDALPNFSYVSLLS